MKHRHFSSEQQNDSSVTGPHPVSGKVNLGGLRALILSRFANSGVYFIVIMLLARTMTASEYGIIMTAMSITTFVAGVSDLGASDYVIRSYSKGQVALANAGCVACVVLNMLLIGVSTIVLMLLVIGYGMPLYYVALTLPPLIDNCTDTILSIFVASDRPRLLVVSIVVRRSLLLLGTVVSFFFFADDAVIGFAITLLVAAISGFGYAVVHRIRSRIDSNFDLRSLHVAVNHLLPFALARIFDVLRTVDVAVVSIAAGSYVAGLYSIIARVASSVAIPAISIAQYLVRDTALLDHMSRWLLTRRIVLYALVSEFFFIGISVFSGELVRLMVGAQYLSVAFAFRIMILCLPLYFLVPPLVAIVRGAGGDVYIALITPVFSIGTLATVYWGSLEYGVTGAVVFACLSQFVYVVLVGVWLRRRRGVSC